MLVESLIALSLFGSGDAFELTLESLAKFALPSPPTHTQEQLYNMTVLERIQARDWGMEYIGIGSIVGYIVLYAIGHYWNKSKVTSWLKAHETVLKDQFFQVGCSEDEPLIEDNSENFASYASGRLNIAQLKMRFFLQPRHNLFLYFMEVIVSFFFASIIAPEDKIELEVTLDKTASERLDQFIWAVVNKNNMNKYREFNYYLSLTRTIDSEKLPLQFVFMSEASELNEALYSQDLSKAVVNSGNVLRYLAVTDQPQEKPKTILETRPNKRFILQLNFASSSDVENSKAIVQAFIQFVDYAVKKELKPETVKKVLKVRDNEIKKIQKVQEDARKEEEEYQRAEKRRNLTEEQQKKAEKKKQKKAMKQQRVR